MLVIVVAVCAHAHEASSPRMKRIRLYRDLILSLTVGITHRGAQADPTLLRHSGPFASAV